MKRSHTIRRGLIIMAAAAAVFCSGAAPLAQAAADDLQVTISQTPVELSASGSVQFRYEFLNNSNADMSNVRILDDAIVFTADNSSVTTWGPRNITSEQDVQACTIGTIGSQKTSTCDVNYFVPQTAFGAGTTQVWNWVVVTYKDSSGATQTLAGQYSSPVRLILDPKVDLTLSVDPKTATVGDPVVWTLLVTNTGNVGLDGLAFSDSALGMADGTSLDDHCFQTAAPSVTLGDFLATSDWITPSDSFICKLDPYTLTKSDFVNGQFVNTAAVTASVVQGSPVTSQASATVTLVDSGSGSVVPPGNVAAPTGGAVAGNNATPVLLIGMVFLLSGVVVFGSRKLVELNK